MRSFWLVGILLGVLTGQACGYLVLHPENPHYFLETQTGKPVLFASCGGLVPTSHDFDWQADAREQAKHDVLYWRIWHFLPWAGESAIWPWERSSVPGAPMGGNKLDLNRWNPEYWKRMRGALALADELGAYAEPHLFDRCGMNPPAPNRWQGNPWASDNNINRIETPPASSSGTPDFYQWENRPRLARYQQRWVSKFLDETCQYQCILYEIENEHLTWAHPDWAIHWARFIKSYLTEHYPDRPRLVSYSSLQSDLEACYDVPELDIINWHCGRSQEVNPDQLNRYLEPHWQRGKAMNVDEFANGLGDPDVLRQMVWTILMSGGNYHIEDPTPEARPVEQVELMQKWLRASKWDFVHAAPNRSLVTTGDGYCMAQPGVEYVAYFPKGGDKGLSLEPGRYEARWWNPRTASWADKERFDHAGGARDFITPGEGDWVLQVRAQ